ncbi:MAG: TrkA family potassium uptake protein [Bacteroides sp.]|nr:TrkA family potassium uptake protein [Bacteroides sp.]
MKYIIIGLGNYGSVLAQELTSLGHEVIGADITDSRVDAIKNKIATAFIIDATEERSLDVLPLNRVDAVIVTIGENFGASIRVTALLKQKNVKHIYARSIDRVHRAILEGFNIDRILTPEEDAAFNLARQLDFGSDIDTFHIDKDHLVAKFIVPDKFVGHSLKELSLRKEFNLKLITLTRAGVVTNLLGFAVTQQTVEKLADVDMIQAGDELVCYGTDKDFQSLWKAL